MATHSSVLAWRIPGTGEPGRLQSMGSRRVGHDWATSLSLFTFLHWRRKWQPTPVFLPEESRGRGSLVFAIYGLHRVRHDWSDLAAAAAAAIVALILWPPDAEPSHWKRPWCWERLKAKGEGSGRGMRWSDSIINLMDMNLSKFQEIVEDRGAWHNIVHRVAESVLT